jgi:hypothetical protein
MNNQGGNKHKGGPLTEWGKKGRKEESKQKRGRNRKNVLREQLYDCIHHMCSHELDGDCFEELEGMLDEEDKI